MNQEMMLWRRLDQPGHELVRLWSSGLTWHVAGTALFAHDQRPCHLDYHLVCDQGWCTRSGHIGGWVGDVNVEIELSVDTKQRWWLNDEEIPVVRGCLDLDLNFSPSTNLLPVRRLGLAVGQEATVKAAWLRFPSFKLEPLEQLYRRLSPATYRYESAGGTFVTELTVNAAGFVTDYPDYWVLEAEL
jgi:uncharacterized protein